MFSDISKADDIIAKAESDVTQGHITVQTDELAVQAQQDLINEINKFTSSSQASKSATMISAYDPLTRKISIGSSNANITADMLHPITVNYIEKQLGVKIGEFTSFCKNQVGACAEISAADKLIRQGSLPEKIKFTNALRPRSIYEKGKMTPSAIIEPCENCKISWPKGD